MSNRRVIIRRDLKPDKRFRSMPFIWLDEGIVVDSLPVGNQWLITYNNPQIINPPGFWYDDPERPVRLIQSPNQSLIRPRREFEDQSHLLISDDWYFNWLKKLRMFDLDVLTDLQRFLHDPENGRELRDAMLRLGECCQSNLNRVTQDIIRWANGWL